MAYLQIQQHSLEVKSLVAEQSLIGILNLWLVNPQIVPQMIPSASVKSKLLACYLFQLVVCGGYSPLDQQSVLFWRPAPEHSLQKNIEWARHTTEQNKNTKPKSIVFGTLCKIKHDVIIWKSFFTYVQLNTVQRQDTCILYQIPWNWGLYNWYIVCMWQWEHITILWCWLTPMCQKKLEAYLG